MDEKKEGRLSNFELLRIISIVMILIHHYSLHNGLISNINTTPIVKFFSMFAEKYKSIFLYYPPEWKVSAVSSISAPHR